MYPVSLTVLPNNVKTIFKVVNFDFEDLRALTSPGVFSGGLRVGRNNSERCDWRALFHVTGVPDTRLPLLSSCPLLHPPSV